MLNCFHTRLVDGESQTSFLPVFLRGGGSVHRLLKNFLYYSEQKKPLFRIGMTTLMSLSYNCKLRTLLLTRSACDFDRDFLDIVYCLFTGGDAWQIDVCENKI